ncbi:hypothetical protein GBA65_12830 [Rubrobacter marinus]|uniref:NERD domain-containing protein n=1 Tax=Rubrobacter marinus TaxID=2653852 RepID=A0A6G8PYH2_9ACTN|nr:NERD domain-containing protein [Rubrobacter marinus]QIN79253.1 hypothetical protein GBA65_12830 [Rubrobacter marinus]
MNCWVMAFVGEHAKSNYDVARRTNTFCVSSSRTPIRRARAGDRVLLYLAGEGFAAEARISSSASSPDGVPRWYSKKTPLWRISIEDVRFFEEPVLYRFPGDGNHPALGFHRYSLTSGFLAIPEDGFEDVLGWSRAGSSSELAEDSPAPEVVANEALSVPPRPSVRSRRSPDSVPSITVDPEREREKRMAGQHALHEGRKRVAMWTVAEMGASLLNLKGVRRYARSRVRAAETTWVSGGRAEERVGEELEKLLPHGFYIFHDVPLRGLGNVDHVVLGPNGFFSVETKSHSGHVTARGGRLARNGRPFEKDFVKQAWSGCYRLREILDAEVAPLLLFTDAFVEGRMAVRGVRVLPLKWTVGEILAPSIRHETGAVKMAVSKLSSNTGCHPSAAPRLA